MSENEVDFHRLMDLNFQVFSFVMGLCLGSFLNVVISRLPERLSIVLPPSRCPKCEKPIAWYDNIPLVSWLVLLGRCRSCRAPISARYPTVELLVGLLALAVARQFGLTPLAVCFLIFVVLLVAITYVDLDTWHIPDVLVFPGIAIGLIGSIAFNPGMRWWEPVLGAAGGFAIFAAIAYLGTWAFKKEAMGQGDWSLMAMIGAFLGWKAWLPVIFLSSLQGAAVGLLLMALGRGETGTASTPAPAGDPPAPTVAHGEATSASESAEGREDDDDWVPPRHAVPFGPFLAMAAMEQLFFGDWILETYQHLLHGM
jgi:leader peptidase (prepilin peptidase)/N-methyltransferase